MELREQVAKIIDDYASAQPIWQNRLHAADRILAIPEIAEALGHKRRAGASYGYCEKCGALLPEEAHLPCDPPSHSISTQRD